MSVVAEWGRVEASGYRFSPQAVPPRAGKGSWISLPAEQNGQVASRPVAVLLRRQVELAAAPRQVWAWFSADAACRIFINGQLVARGPDDIGEDYNGTQTGKWLANFRDLTPFFRQGKNLIAAEVFSGEGFGSRTTSKGQSAFLFESQVQFLDGTNTSIVSDLSWPVLRAPQWKMAEGFLRFDAAQEPAGWLLPAFDDAAWPRASLLAPEPWQPLLQSKIAPRMEAIYPMQSIVRASEQVSVPARPFQDGHSVVVKGDGSFAVRFDRVLSGYISLRVRGSRGAILSIQPNELNKPGFHRMATMSLRDGEQTFELPFYDSFSTINIQAQNVLAPIEITEVRATFVSYPASYRGRFRCSDAHLNRIWEASRWLSQICRQTHHLDSPHHQEPICDPGDYLIESLNSFYAFGDSELARQDLRKYSWLLRQSHFKPFHTSYALLWLQWLLDYAGYSGDTALVRELAPEVHALLDQFALYRGRNGLICEAPDYMFMDWIDIAGFTAHHPPAVIGQGYMTAFYYRALADGQRVARLSGDSARIERYAALRREVAQAFERELWDDKAELYRDGKPFQTAVPPSQWLPADAEIETHSTQVNALAVLYDLAPPQRQPGLMRQVLAEPKCQPYFMHFVLDAMAHAGLFESEGLNQIRRWKIVEDTQSFREMWDEGDLSHAWQCTPLYQLSSRVLGVTPIEPGFKVFAIRPQLCDLEWAEGAVPTPHGSIEVAWRRHGNGLSLSVAVPPGSEAVLSLPGAQPAQANVTANGQVLWRGGKVSRVPGVRTVRALAGALEVRLQSGTYIFDLAHTDGAAQG